MVASTRNTMRYRDSLLTQRHNGALQNYIIVIFGRWHVLTLSSVIQLSSLKYINRCCYQIVGFKSGLDDDI